MNKYQYVFDYNLKDLRQVPLSMAYGNCQLIFVRIKKTSEETEVLIKISGGVEMC